MNLYVVVVDYKNSDRPVVYCESSVLDLATTEVGGRTQVLKNITLARFEPRLFITDQTFYIVSDTRDHAATVSTADQALRFLPKFGYLPFMGPKEMDLHQAQEILEHKCLEGGGGAALLEAMVQFLYTSVYSHHYL
ncbi:unnamed protein product [Timema podura]|uniref:Uncharacterized protein n=1 Tax=Timema podura TaxID=61482 RepID=A0ABN7PG76_TIMPD|nr:unnamed protein product [Timema podura]